MSEKYINTPEAGHESLSDHQIQESLKNRPEVDHQAAKSEQAKQLEAARNSVEAQTTNKEKTLHKFEDQQADKQTRDSAPINKELKKITLKKEMSHIRRRLTKPDRLASKIIHQPAIRVISEASAKTISRPSGLLGGGITAFVGTSLYYYFTKHIGVKYNYLIFIALFVAGFGIGVCIELIVWALRTKKKLV